MHLQETIVYWNPFYFTWTWALFKIPWRFALGLIYFTETSWLGDPCETRYLTLIQKKSQNCDEFLKAADCICGKRVNLHSSKKKAVLFPLFFWISLIQSRWKYQGWDHLVTLENMAWYPVVSFSLSCLTFNHWWIKPTCCQISVILPKGVTLPEAAMKQNLWELISKVTTRRGNTLYSGKYNKREKKENMYLNKPVEFV